MLVKPGNSNLTRLLSFEVCGGFSKQRIALLSGKRHRLPAGQQGALFTTPTLTDAGLVLAADLNRTMLLPYFASTKSVGKSLIPFQ
jgi:hypothetical protein